MGFRATESENESEADERVQRSQGVSTANGRTGKVSTAAENARTGKVSTAQTVQRETTTSSRRSANKSNGPFGTYQQSNEQFRRNKRSVVRSKYNAKEDGPAGDTGVPESVRKVVSSPGQSLDASVQRAMEDQMGDSFGDVEVHTGARAASACDDSNAKAFTVGTNIAFNSGEYVRVAARYRPQESSDLPLLPVAERGYAVDIHSLCQEAADCGERFIDAAAELGHDFDRAQIPTLRNYVEQLRRNE